MRDIASAIVKLFSVFALLFATYFLYLNVTLYVPPFHPGTCHAVNADDLADYRLKPGVAVFVVHSNIKEGSMSTLIVGQGDVYFIKYLTYGELWSIDTVEVSCE